ncbi:alpha-2-macroglobulin receptor-associated protein, partial [Silurus asotus]
SLFLCVCLAVGGMAGKYSRDVNEQKVESEGKTAVEFRIAKLNQVWEKANRMQLAPRRLSELHSDLKIQEKDELQWKKLKAEGLDEDGEREAKLRRNFNIILAKYGMDGKKDNRALDSANLKDHDSKLGEIFGDPRLEKLWNKAMTSGKFSEEELQSLRKEFEHHKEKIHEYNIMIDTVSRTEGLFGIFKPKLGCTYFFFFCSCFSHEAHFFFFVHVFHMNKTLRQSNNLRNGTLTYECINVRVFRGTSGHSVALLRKQKTKEELKHFETKVEKHHHYQEQLEYSHQKLQHIEAMGDKEHISRHKEKYNTLAEKAREIGYKMKKHLQDITNKISQNGLQHNEL